ncbi:MAG: MFS transporter [Deltaproteobacteria bacterium]|nr:MFS transporter [Deltaproteobacteria bacterium]
MPPTGLLAFYISAAFWNVCMGMVQVLLPLYAFSLGFSVLKISSIISLAVLAEFLIRFLGSALSDRFGERRTLQGCYFLLFMAALVLLSAGSYIQLLLAQAIANFSRSNFWISVQSLASQLPGLSIGKRLGRLSACNNCGNLIGLSLGGILAALLGYHRAFLLLAVTALVCILFGLMLPNVDPKPAGRTIWEITRGIGRFLGYRRTWLAISVSYAAALPAALAQSIYPIYFSTLEYGEQWIGVTISVRSLTPVLIGLMFGALITTSIQKRIFALGMAGLGFSLMVSGLTEKIFLNALGIAVLGAAGAVLDLLYQVQASEWSASGDRSAAMASTGLGWLICPFSAPIIVGWLVEGQGFRFAFLVAGVFFLLVAAGTRLWHRLVAP